MALDDSRIIKDTLLTPADIAEYKSFIQKRVDFIVINGVYHHGNGLKALDQPRRGWLVRGLYPLIAETSKEHSNKLKEAGEALCSNPDSDVSIEIMSPLLGAHDDSDKVFYDVIPADNISKEDQQDMEYFGMELLYGSLNNGLGKIKMAYYERWIAHKLRESVSGFYLDKQDAATNARKIQNTFDKVRVFYKNNPLAQEWLLTKIYSSAKSLDDALEKTYNRLSEFYIDNKEEITEPFFRYIADEVEKFQGDDVYTHYYNLLSTVPISDFKK